MMSLLLVDVYHLTAQFASANVSTAISLVEVDLKGGKFLLAILTYSNLFFLHITNIISHTYKNTFIIESFII